MPWAEAAAFIGGAYLSSQGAQGAADTQAQASRDATAAQTAASDRSNQTQLELQQNALNFEQNQTSPYTSAGQTALAAYMQQLGLTPPATGTSSAPASATAPLTRDQWIQKLTPQFTKTPNGGTLPSGALGMWMGANGPNGYTGSNAGAGLTVDTAGLNAAVDAAMKQQALPAQAPTVAGPVNNGQSQPFDVSKIPGYNFMKKEALDALTNSASATTGNLSGNAQKALVDRISGLASTQYGSYLDRIAGLVSLGENAGVNTGNTGVGIIQGAGNNISANQMALGGAIGSNIIGAGNSAAAGQVAASNAWGSAANTIFGNQQTQKSLSSLFGGSGGISDSTANSINNDEMARITAQAYAE